MQPDCNMENDELQKKSDQVVWIEETWLPSAQMSEQERMC